MNDVRILQFRIIILVKVGGHYKPLLANRRTSPKSSNNEGNVFRKSWLFDRTEVYSSGREMPYLCNRL